MATPTTLQEIVSLFSGHSWLLLIALVTLYVRKILSPASGFPLNVKPRWLPVVTAGGAMVSGFITELQAGQPIGTALIGVAILGGAGGFGDALLTAIFDHDNAPAWARAIVFVFDDITGGGPGGTPAKRLRGGSAFGWPMLMQDIVAPTKSPAPQPVGNLSNPFIGVQRFFGVVLVAFASSVVGATTGCAAVSQWWQLFQQDPAANISSFVQYVEGFIQTARAIWDLISPILGANTQSGNAAFNSAIVTLEDSLAALQDGVQAAVIAQTTSPDFSQLIAKVQDAVAQVIGVIQTWQPPTVRDSLTGERATLQHQAHQIATWRKQ